MNILHKFYWFISFSHFSQTLFPYTTNPICKVMLCTMIWASPVLWKAYTPSTIGLGDHKDTHISQLCTLWIIDIMLPNLNRPLQQTAPAVDLALNNNETCSILDKADVIVRLHGSHMLSDIYSLIFILLSKLIIFSLTSAIVSNFFIQVFQIFIMVTQY